MSKSRRKSVFVPDGWVDVLVRSLLMFPVAFIALNLKEYIDSGAVDIAGCAVDAAWVAAVTLVFYASVAITAGGGRRAESRVAATAAR